MQFPIFSSRIYLAAGLVFLVNVLILNDVQTVLPRGELDFLGFGMPSIWTNSMGGHLIGRIFHSLGPDFLFPVRLFSMVFFLTAMAMFYGYGRKLFGGSTLVISFLILGSSLAVPFLAKFALLDFWVLPFQVAGGLGLVLFMKQPLAKWRFLFWSGVIGAGVFDLPGTMIWLISLYLILRIFNPQGRALKGLFVWVFVLAGLVFFFVSGGWKQPDVPGLFFSLVRLDGSIAASMIFGFLPWIGFFVAGLWELGVRWKDGQEMAVVLGTLVLAFTLSGSLLAHFLVAVVLARQVQFYFGKAYPYRGLVKAVALLHLVLVFCLAIVAMLSAYYWLEGSGFRRMMLIGAAYWIPAFVGVVGLLGGRASYAVGGMAGTGLGVALAFWVLGGPVLEARRNLAPRAVDQMESVQLGPAPTVLMKIENRRLADQIRFYSKGKEIEVEVLDTVPRRLDQSKGYFLDAAGREALEEKNLPAHQEEMLEGWSEVGKSDSLWIIWPVGLQE